MSGRYTSVLRFNRYLDFAPVGRPSKRRLRGWALSFCLAETEEPASLHCPADAQMGSGRHEKLELQLGRG